MIHPALARVLYDVRAERDQQDAKWGEQNHPDGTDELAGASVVYGLMREMDVSLVGHKAGDAARNLCDRATRAGYLTWRDIFIEEVFEAIEERDPQALRNELVQVMAVAAAWVQCIDRRELKRAA